ncbi:MAG: hypothetical protein ACR2HE_06500 [Casimicrobiaceae bacterium]
MSIKTHAQRSWVQKSLQLRWARVVLGCVAVSLSTACALPYRPYQVGVGSSGTALGIKSTLNSHKGSQEVDVFLVHGMCTHGRDWVASANNHLAAALGINQRFDEKSIGEPVHVAGGETELYRKVLDVDGGKKVVSHAIVWSPVTIDEKKTLCYDRDDDRDAPAASYCTGEYTSPYVRARLNRDLQNSLMNDCLADAIVYVGPKKERIQAQMQEVIEYAAADRAKSKSRADLRAHAATEQTPLFVITESLGSKIFFDSLLLMVCEGHEASAAAAGTVGRTAQIFMGANQVPILSLAAPLVTSLQGPRCRAETAAFGVQLGRARPAAEDPLNELFRRFGARQKSFTESIDSDKARLPTRAEVVVFDDPNDLLSWPLKYSQHETGITYRSVDVIVSNAFTWFGYAEHPLHAHTDYRVNPDVRRIIACGLPVAEDC